MDLMACAPAPFLPSGTDPAIPWSRWTGIFQNYLTAIGGDAFPVERRRAILLTCLGAEGQRIFNSLPASVKREGEDEFSFAQRRLDDYYAPRMNVCAERYRFRSRGQQQGESVAAWVTALRQLASSCAYGQLTEELIRDQVVERTVSPRLRQRLLMEGSDLTLETTLTIASTLESAERESRVMESAGGASGPAPVQAVNQVGGQRRRRPPQRPRQQGTQRQQQQQPRQRQQPAPPEQQQRCFGCGSPDHLSRDRECPARGQQCHKCGQLNHFARWCRGQRTVQGYRVSQLEVLSVGQSQLSVPATVGNRAVDFVVDTGSPVSILPRSMVEGELEEADNELCVYNGSKLQVLGKKSVTMSCKGKTVSVSVYVVPCGRPLMGLDLMKVFAVNVVDNKVCHVSAGIPSDPASSTPTSPGPEASPHLQPSQSPSILGFQHRVKVNPSVPPVRQPLRRLPLTVKDEVSDRLDELERQGVIERVSAASWVSPLVVGRKRDGRIRLCVDMRRVNEAVITDGYPLPRIEEVLDRLRGSQVFTRFDLKDAYHQVELHPESRDLTTFVTHQGLYRFTRVNFGLASAGPCFQRIMASMLGDIRGVEVYLDDVICHGRTQAEHDTAVSEVLKRFTAHRVQVNHSKSVRNQTEILFLGYQISATGVRIDPERVRPLLEAADPSDERTLRAFLGAVSYHSRFIPRCSEAVEPLRAALRSVPFVWTAALSETARVVKDMIRRAPSLSMFDPALRTVVTTDASDVGCGACLTQVSKSGEVKLIAYASKSLSSAERSYSVVEREALSCVWACEKWRHYLWGRRFVLRTDHQALLTIYGPKGSNRVGRRVARWEARLLDFTFDVEYIKSERNLVADGLSRLPVSETAWVDDDTVQIAALLTSPPHAVPGSVSAISASEFEEASAVDEELTEVRERLQGQWPDNRRQLGGCAAAYHSVRAELSAQGSLVFRGNRLVVPAELRARVLANAHAGHQGRVRTTQRLRERFWWPRMDAEVKALVRECDVCSSHDEHVKVTKPPLQPIPRPGRAWQRVMVDVIGPMKGPPSEQYGIVLVDLHSRWPEVALCGDATAGTIVKFLTSVFTRESAPEELVSDNGPAFRSAELGAFLRTQGVKQVFSSPYSPQTCGLVERFNRTVKGAIQSARLAGEPRATFVRDFLREYRATPHPATGETPFLAMRGREARTAVDVLPVPEPQPAPVRSRRAAQRFRKHQAVYKARHDRSSTGPPKWEEGDWVRVRAPVSGRVEGRTPVQIERRTGPLSYRLSTGERVHARRLVDGKADSESTPVSSPGPSSSVHSPYRSDPGSDGQSVSDSDASPELRRSSRVTQGIPAARYTP